jgi:predicted DNA binding CopG/RHH family protein
MKTVKLDKEELRIENEFEQFKPAQKSIRNKFEKIISESRKSRPISLRINEQDLNLLKEKAGKNGLPYQTMINVIIHRYVNDSYLDKDEIDKYLKLKRAI